MARRTSRTSAGPETALLWAPWRAAYVGKAPVGAPKCIFCFGRMGAATRRRRLVVHAGRLALVMLNRYPYNNGHLMVAPRRHVATPELLSSAERSEISEIVTGTIERLRAAYRPASTWA